MKKFIFVIVICSFLLDKIFAQTGYASLSGFVYDSSTGEVLIGANVYLKGVNLGTSTNLSGYYVIPRITPGNYELIVSYVGFNTYNQKIFLKANESKRLDIRLTPTAILSEEIVVSADSINIVDKLYNKPVSKIEITPAQISKVPQVVEADLLRTLQSLPGIVPLSDFSSAIYVRGGTPDQNLFLLDGTDVYNPEHAFGLFSTFNTDAIKKVEVYKGGFGAEYGGRLSSVINITNNDGNRNNFEGKASLSLLTLNTTLQAPLGNFGSLSGSLRRTYLDQTVAKIFDDIPDYYFLDGNLKAFFDIDKSNKLSISFYGGVDNLNFVFDKNRSESFGFNYKWGNRTGSINWRTIINPKLFGNFWLTYSQFFSNFDFNEAELNEQNHIDDITLKGALEYFHNDKLNFKFGFELKNASGFFKENIFRNKIDVSRHPKLYSLYITNSWSPTPLLNFETGIRYDHYISTKNYDSFDPRFSAKYRIDNKSNIKFSTGLYHQYAHRIPRVFMTSIWTSADEYIKGSNSLHYILSYQREIFGKAELEIEAYYKTYHNIYSLNPNLYVDIEPIGYTQENYPIYGSQKNIFFRGDGNSKGIELLIRKDLGALTGWFAYSFSKTKYKIDNTNKGIPFPPRHDRTHAINFVANFNINDFLNEINGTSNYTNKKWLVGFNLTYFSGQPITLPSSIYIANPVPDWNINLYSIALYPSSINKYRLPYYARLDLSINYEIQYKGWSLSPYLQIFNLLNRKNVWFIFYDEKIKDDSIIQLEVKNVNMLPIIPSIGISARF